MEYGIFHVANGMTVNTEEMGYETAVDAHSLCKKIMSFND